MTNKANQWQPTGEWTLKAIEKNVIITNETNDQVLAIIDDCNVTQRRFVENDAKQLWKKGAADTEGYFTLTNLHSQKLLIADSGVLKVLGMKMFIQLLNLSCIYTTNL